MTKLKKPITLTIETIEDAIGLRLALNVPESTPISMDADKKPARQTVAPIKHSGALGSRRKIEEQLSAQGIDWTSWRPEGRFKMADQECTFNANGTVTFSCGTTVDNDDINEFLKLRKAAMGVGEWPKYYLAENNVVWRSDHTGNYRQWWEGGRWNRCPDGQARPDNGTSITHEAAAGLIGAENLLKFCPQAAAEPVAVVAGAASGPKTADSAKSIAATADLFDALKGLYDAVRMLRAETIAIDKSRSVPKPVMFKAAR
jgi:hypothetical protein